MTKAVRPIRVVGSLAYIPLTKGYEAIIDAADVHLVEGYNWFALARHGKTVYARRNTPGPIQRTVLLHRAICQTPDGLQLDHRDGNGLNNSRANLRFASIAQNQQNKRLRQDNTSGLKGVDFHKGNGLWRARIQANGKSKCLGYHTTPEAARAAYAEASALLHGDFARTA